MVRSEKLPARRTGGAGGPGRAGEVKKSLPAPQKRRTSRPAVARRVSPLTRVLLQTEVEFKTHIRSKVALFWTLLFPIILFVLFSAIFSQQGAVRIDLWVQDNDRSGVSRGFQEALNHSETFNMKYLDLGVDADAEAKAKKIVALVVIPAGCQAELSTPGGACNVTLRLDPSSPEKAGIVRGVVTAVASEFNLFLANGTHRVGVEARDDIANLQPVKASDYYLAGIITMSIITTASFSIVESVATNRDSGLLRKLASTPMSRSEWLAGKMLYLIIVNLLTAGLLVVVASKVFGATVHPHFMIPVLVAVGTITYAGFGLVVLAIVKNNEGAIAVANGIVFPMLFLSGSFIPVDFMPPFMRDVARAIPLTYLNDALRQVTVFGDLNVALVNLAGVFILMVVFAVAGLFLSKWKEEYITAAST